MGSLQLDYTQDELLATHDIVEPLLAGGRRCHGGFLEDGTYVSPRTANRLTAIEAWGRSNCDAFGTELVHVPLDTWPEQYPNVAQSRLLLDEGVREPMITQLTRIGTVEGFGAMLRFVVQPDLQRFFADDLSSTASAHIEKGLFEAHARDEAGWGDEAGHNDMWFAARDIAFESPVTQDETARMLERMGISSGVANAGPPSAETIAALMEKLRVFPQLDFGFEMMLQRMISLLFIEVQAFHTFAWAEEMLDDRERLAGDGEAARIVSYIRADESPHVGYLRVALSEMRDRRMRTTEGGSIEGAEVIGRLWDQALEDSTGPRREEFLRMAVGEVERALEGRTDAADVLAQFHHLGSIRPDGEGRLVGVERA